MRHLHYSGDTHTACGRGRTNAHSVTITKAQPEDCWDCLTHIVFGLSMEVREGVKAGDEFWAGSHAELSAHLAHVTHPELREDA